MNTSLFKIGTIVRILKGEQLPCRWLSRYVVGRPATITGKYQEEGKWFYHTQEYGASYPEADLEYVGESDYVEKACRGVAELFSRAGVEHDWKTTAKRLESI